MAISENGVSNLWAQPIEGGLGHQITDFSSESIGYYQVSRDGKSLLLHRRQIESDIVVLRDNAREPVKKPGLLQPVAGRSSPDIRIPEIGMRRHDNTQLEDQERRFQMAYSVRPCD
jgi:hypothetical protein